MEEKIKAVTTTSQIRRQKITVNKKKKWAAIINNQKLQKMEENLMKTIQLLF